MLTIREFVIQMYYRLGYTESKGFPGEYLLRYNPRTCDSVRIYDNGQIWELSRVIEDDNSEYVKVTDIGKKDADD